MPEITVGISCPVCGGAIKMNEGAHTLSCQYCTSLLFIEGDDGVHTTMFANKLDTTTSTQRVHDWFRKGLKARDLKVKGQFSEIYPIYVPFWRMRARAAGWVCGYREETHTTRDSRGNIRTYTERIPMERMVLRDFEWTEIACDLGDIGIEHLRNLAGDIVLHETGSIPTFEATTSRTDAQGMGKGEILKLAVSSAQVPNITFQKIHVIPKIFGLIFYPVWIVRYKYNERTYFAGVDGVTGQVLSGRAPGDPLYRSLIMTGGAACGAVGGLGLGWGLVSGSTEIGIGAVIVSAVMFFGAYLFFRYGSEITEGDIQSGYKKGFGDIMKMVRVR